MHHLYSQNLDFATHFQWERPIFSWKYWILRIRDTLPTHHYWIKDTLPHRFASKRCVGSVSLIQYWWVGSVSLMASLRCERASHRRHAGWILQARSAWTWCETNNQIGTPICNYWNPPLGYQSKDSRFFRKRFQVEPPVRKLQTLVVDKYQFICITYVQLAPTEAAFQSLPTEQKCDSPLNSKQLLILALNRQQNCAPTEWLDNIYEEAQLLLIIE